MNFEIQKLAPALFPSLHRDRKGNGTLHTVVAIQDNIGNRRSTCSVKAYGDLFYDSLAVPSHSHRAMRKTPEDLHCCLVGRRESMMTHLPTTHQYSSSTFGWDDAINRSNGRQSDASAEGVLLDGSIAVVVSLRQGKLLFQAPQL